MNLVCLQPQVSDVICNVDWEWPSAASDEMGAIQYAICGTIVRCAENDDHVSWQAHLKGGLIAQRFLDYYREGKHGRLVRFNPGSYACAQIWFLRRPTTKTRQVKIGRVIDASCAVCNQKMTRTEITCSSLARLWRMDERLFCKTFWVNEVGHAKQFLPKRSLMSEVLRLTLWQESSRRTPAASEKRFDKNSM